MTSGGPHSNLARLVLFYHISGVAHADDYAAAECPAHSPIRDECADVDGLDRVLNLIAAGYNKNVPPGCSNGTHAGATAVEVQIRMTHLSSVDVKRARASIKGYLRYWWHDPRLAFNDTCFGTIELTSQYTQLLWIPDIYIDNLAGGSDYAELYP